MGCNGIPVTRTSCLNGLVRPGTSCVTLTPPTLTSSAISTMSATGPVPAPRLTAVVLTCTSAVSNTPCCTCCTPGSGTKCFTTWGMLPHVSRIDASTTRVTSKPSPTSTPVACTCPPPRWKNATVDSSTTGKKSLRNTEKWVNP